MKSRSRVLIDEVALGASMGSSHLIMPFGDSLGWSKTFIGACLCIVAHSGTYRELPGRQRLDILIGA